MTSSKKRKNGTRNRVKVSDRRLRDRLHGLLFSERSGSRSRKYLEQLELEVATDLQKSQSRVVSDRQLLHDGTEKSQTPETPSDQTGG